MESRLSETWRTQLLEKIKGKSFFASDFEESIARFLSIGTWLQNDTMQQTLGLSTWECEQMYFDAYQHYESNQFEKSVEIFRVLVLLDPFVDKYWLGLSASFQVLGKYEEALQGYGILAVLDETSPYPYYYASECLQHLSRNEESKHALNQALQYACASPQYLELAQSIKKEL